MIPIKLQIKNFLSYGPEIQTIEFGNYPLICLSGKNGHGKSALLDAITWALWGEARKLGGNAKADQGLLRLGQTQMMICLDFECGQNRYRVRREFMQTYGKPVSILEFGILQDADRFMPLTEKTIRDTQAKIEQTLHLSFDAFINSAFLRQGQANEFSKKSPKERKEILGSILGLDQYETIRKLASEKIRHTNMYKIHLSTLTSKLEQELSQSPHIVEKLTALEQKKRELNTQEEQNERAKKTFEQDSIQLQSARQHHAMLEYQHQQLLNEQDALRTKLKKLVTEWRTIHQQQLAGADYALLEQQKKQIIEQISGHQKTLQDQLTLKQELLLLQEQKSQYVHAFHEKKSQELTKKKIALERLFAEKNHLDATLKDVENSFVRKEREINNYMDELQLLEKQLTSDIQSHKNSEKQFEKRKEHYQQWVAQANMISKELGMIEQKNRLVHDEESPSCPLCEQNLSASRKRFLKQKFEDEKELLKRRFNKLSAVITQLKTILVNHHEELQAIKKKEQEFQSITIKKDALCKTLEKYQLEKNDIQANRIKYKELLVIVLETIKTEQNALDQQLITNKIALETDAEYLKIVAAIQKIEKNLSSNGYEKARHDQAQKTLTAVEKELAQYKELQEQSLFQQQRMHEVGTVIAALKTLHQQLQKITAQLPDNKKLNEQEKLLTQRKQELATLVTHITREKEHLLQEQGSLENQHKKLEHTKQEHAGLQKELATCNQTVDDYQAIATATGKDGIQALLIEDAIPEIEQETNDLLSKLTDNQTHLFIESLRDLKKGGTKETLDIKISDSAGIRPYELFSGGEAFRIDFALRIAISKLLARRAGTSLKTLIIDEGFGSQDEEGLSHIMDALYKIQDDFTKIIIVSHLSSMKSQFPVHFVIEKGPNGSIVEIVEQG
jgi:exonuclease SbcC